MQLPKPPVRHPLEVYHAIIQEYQNNPVTMAQRLHGFGWTLADEAWAAVHCSPLWMAAAIANERTNRDADVTTFPKTELAKIKVEIGMGRKTPATARPMEATRIVRAIPEFTARVPMQG